MPLFTLTLIGMDMSVLTSTEYRHILSDPYNIQIYPFCPLQHTGMSLQTPKRYTHAPSDPYNERTCPCRPLQNTEISLLTLTTYKHVPADPYNIQTCPCCPCTPLQLINNEHNNQVHLSCYLVNCPLQQYYTETDTVTNIMKICPAQ